MASAARNGTASSAAQEFERVVDALQAPLGRFVAQMVSDGALAEDVLQETFCVAWRQRARMPAGAGDQRGWFYGVARNQALHALRKQRRGRRAVDALAAQPLSAPRPGPEPLAMRDFVAGVLGPQDRSLFLLRYVHEFSAPELADMTGMRPATIRKRLERSATALRAAIADETVLQKGEPHGHAFTA